MKQEAKCKKCRREGGKLYLKGERCLTARCAVVKRNYPPGLHGQGSKSRLSIYGQQLREKQKVKNIYGIGEKQLRNYFTKAIKTKGDTGEIILKFLELRLDNIIYRLGLASSRAASRQLINHGHFLVNNKKVKIPSYQLKVNDLVTFSTSSKNKNFLKDLAAKLEKQELPEWLNLDRQELKAKVLDLPEFKKLKQLFDIKLIVEYYSR